MAALTRRTFITGGIALPIAAASAFTLTRVSAAEITIPQVPLTGTPTPVGTPASDRTIYPGDMNDLWSAPWNFGDHYIEMGGAIVQRFLGADGMGFKLSDDGVVVRNAFLLDGYLKFYVGTNQDIDSLASAKALKVRGFYGGVSSSEIYGYPIILAFEIAKGA